VAYESNPVILRDTTPKRRIEFVATRPHFARIFHRATANSRPQGFHMHSLRTFRFLAVVAFASSVAAMAGCGPTKTEVSGTIKINGKVPNVKGLEIVFLGTDGILAAAPINADGTYTASGVAVGEAKISFAFLPNKATEVQGKRNLNKPSDKAGPKDAPKNPVPEPLRDSSTSKITFSVASGGKSVFDYDIKP
jgi:hypothetical protein